MYTHTESIFLYITLKIYKKERIYNDNTKYNMLHDKSQAKILLKTNTQCTTDRECKKENKLQGWGVF